jgi:4a-hydroxytetrahydrobiopterin dehydratase
MSEPSALQSAHCEPCHGGTAPLSSDEVDKLLRDVTAWSASDAKQIQRDFKFADFAAALAFVNRVGALAEEQGHHPDILLHGWNKVRLTLSTHAIGGLSRNDFIMAAKVDTLDR